YAEEAARFKAEGWTAYKIHPPTDPVTDVAVCQAVRRALGDGFTVMLDSTWAYQYPEALRVGRVAQDLGFYWYEDPLADDDLCNSEFFEVLLPAAAQKYGLRQDIEVDARGLVHAPAGPGLGAAIDFDLITRLKTAVLS